MEVKWQNEAERHGRTAAQADWNEGRTAYDPAHCLLMGNSYATAAHRTMGLSMEAARKAMQEWIIGYAAFYEEQPQ